MRTIRTIVTILLVGVLLSNSSCGNVKRFLSKNKTLTDSSSTVTVDSTKETSVKLNTIKAKEVSNTNHTDSIREEILLTINEKPIVDGNGNTLYERTVTKKTTRVSYGIRDSSVTKTSDTTAIEQYAKEESKYNSKTDLKKKQVVKQKEVKRVRFNWWIWVIVAEAIGIIYYFIKKNPKWSILVSLIKWVRSLIRG